MNRAANPHWIGPKRGTYVTVALKESDLCDVGIGGGVFNPSGRTLFRGVVVEQYRARFVDDVLGHFQIKLDPAGLDSTWCYDWSGDNVDALEALIKLRCST